jgi:opacity protein-like surface antigen
MRNYLLSGVALVALMGAAGAADLSYKAPLAPLPSPHTDWSGFYVGLEGGYGFGNQSFDFTGANVFPTGPAGFARDPFAFPGSGSANNNGWLAGGFFGAQKQYGGWVFGIEGDVDATGLKGSFQSTIAAPETVNLVTRVPEFVTTTPVTINQQTLTVNGATVTTPAQIITVNGQNITLPSQALTVQPVTAPVTGTAVIGPQGLVLTATLTGATVANGVPAGTVIPVGSPVPVVLYSGGNLSTNQVNLTTTAPVTVAANGTATFTSGSGGNVRIGGGVGAGINVTTAITTTGGTALVTGTAAVPGQVIITAAQNIVVAGQIIAIPAATLPVVNGTVTVPAFTIPGQMNQVLDANGAAVLQRVLTPTVMTVTRTVAVDTKIDELASLRGRVGYAVWDNVLLYGTGGLALAHASATSTLTQTIGGSAPQVSTSSASGTMLGWALGAGADFKLTQNVFLGVEYLHSDFPKNTFAFVDGNGSGFSLGNDHLKVDAVKARVGFLFN